MSQGQRIILSVFAAVIFAFIVRGIFAIHGLDRFFSIMSIAFLMGLPFGVGYLTVYHIFNYIGIGRPNSPLC